MARKPYRRFASLETEVVWAAVERLDIAQKHILLDALTEELFVDPHLRVNGPSAREARAVLALREATKLLGHSPSIGEFSDLFERHPEYGWPHASRVRAWLGSNSWNLALERAGLEACASDAIIREKVGARFSEGSLIRHLRLAAAELGGGEGDAGEGYGDRGFTFEQYSHWARRPDVVARHGLLARSLQTFIRVFGSWSEAYMAAGLREEHVLVNSRGVTRYARHKYERSDLKKALKLAAEKLGHSPTVVEYRTLRAKLRQEGTLLPSEDAIRRPFASAKSSGEDATGNEDWAAACVDAGLAHPGESVTAAFSEEEMLRFVAQAIAAGHDTARGYDEWRDSIRHDSKKEGKKLRVPSSTSVRKRFHSWTKAVAAAGSCLEASQ